MDNEEPQNVSDLYASNQAIFDRNFDQIMIKLFAGFERSVFEKLAVNDEADSEEWQEGDIQYFSDGTPAVDNE